MPHSDAPSSRPCPRCGSTSLPPFAATGAVCLRCAGERAFSLTPDALATPPPDSVPADADPSSAPAADSPLRIGAYEIIEELGRGGMARVYAARQGQLGRIVALKTLPLGQGTTSDLEMRFLREAQTVARLRHPHIVAIHDSGRTATHAYFSMDYIDGGDLAHRLRERPFTPREAATLLRKIAVALSAAHAEGVLHRDLKPSNILLDGDEPRLADFGLAAQLEVGGDLTAKTSVLGTPHYLAPEALTGGSAALGIPSDLYALGVVAFELLTGRTPFAGAAPAELATLINDTEPPSPRLLAPAVPVDLETIVLQCLEREPARRYASAADLAADLDRFLAGEPIAARPPGPLDRLARFTRRHRHAVIATSAAFAILVAATAVSTSLAVRATRAEKAAEAEARTSKALADFLRRDLLQQAAPGEEPDRDVKLHTILDRAATKLDSRFTDAPLIEADVREVVADVYGSLGNYTAAHRHAVRVLALRRQHQGPDHLDTVTATLNVAVVLTDQGKHADAEPLFAQVLAARQRLLDPAHADTLAAANHRALNLRTLNRIPEADNLQTATLAVARRTLSATHPTVIRGLATLARIRHIQTRFPEAEALLREAIDLQTQSLGAENLDTLTTRNDLAVILKDSGKIDEAVAQYEAILALRRRVLSPDHPHVFISLGNLGGAYKAQRRFAEAAAAQSAALELGRRLLSPAHPRVLTTLTNLADTLGQQQQFDKASALQREALALYTQHSGPDHALTQRAREKLADLQIRAGRPAEAEPVLREALALRLTSAPASWQTAFARIMLGHALSRQGRHAEAEPLLLTGYADLLRAAEPITPSRRRVATEAKEFLVELYTAWSQPDTAKLWREKPVVFPVP
jgi:tetratricopeptide (TPR) repeat protein